MANERELLNLFAVIVDNDFVGFDEDFDHACVYAASLTKTRSVVAQIKAVYTDGPEGFTSHRALEITTPKKRT
jgi:hypothetical protein